MQDTVLLTPWPWGAMDRNLANDIVTWVGIKMPGGHHGRATHDPSGSRCAEFHNPPAQASCATRVRADAPDHTLMPHSRLSDAAHRAP